MRPLSLEEVQPVDLWIVIGDRDTPRTQAMLKACQGRWPVLVLGDDDFRPALLTSDLCIGVVPALPEAEEAARRLVEHLGRIMVGGNAELFGIF